MRTVALLIAATQGASFNAPSVRRPAVPRAAWPRLISTTDDVEATITTISIDSSSPPTTIPIDFFVVCPTGDPTDADRQLCQKVVEAHRDGDVAATAAAIEAISRAGAPIAVELIAEATDHRAFRLPQQPTPLEGSSAAASAAATLVLREVTFGASGFGHRVWEAGVALAVWLALNAQTTVAGKRVLELGSGVGTAGLAASLLGATSVTLTDVGKVLPNLAHNAALNAAADGMHTRELDWQTCLDAGFAPAEGAPYEVVLASDCIYYEADAPALAAAVNVHLAPGGQAILMCRPRRMGDEGRAADALLESLRAAGLGDELEVEELTIVNNFGRDELMLVRVMRNL